jgi:transcription initiation factor TFIID subunit TAF12
MSRAPTLQQQQQQQQQQQRASQQHPSAFEAIREQAAPLAGSNVGSGSGGWWAGDGAEAQATTDVMLVHEALASVHEAERLQRQAEDVKQQQQQQQQQQHADSLQQGGAGRRESIGGAFVAPTMTVDVLLADHTDDGRSWVGTPASEQNNGNMRSGPGEEKPVSNQVQ